MCGLVCVGVSTPGIVWQSKDILNLFSKNRNYWVWPILRSKLSIRSSWKKKEKKKDHLEKRNYSLYFLIPVVSHSTHTFSLSFSLFLFHTLTPTHPRPHFPFRTKTFLMWPSLISSSRRRQWHPTPVLLPGKSHGRRSLVGCSPWGR